jgi:hypothetical protein
MYDYIGGFWTAITLIILTSTTDEQGSIYWPIIREVCPENSENTVFDLIPRPFNRAQELWMCHNDTNSQNMYFQDTIPMTNSPLNNLIEDYIHYASKKGRLKRIEISLPILGRNCSNEEAWRRTIKAERHKNNNWLIQQRNLARLLKKDIESVNHFSVQCTNLQ